MGDQILNWFGDRLTTAIVLSAVVALAIVAIVALAWWWGRRWTRKRADSWSASLINMGDRMTESRGSRPAAGTPEPSRHGVTAPGEEQWGTRLVRDTAARAAALRDTWDRSYSAARTGPGSSTAVRNHPAPAGGDAFVELIEEQRRTNALLGEVLAELRKRR